MSQYTTISFSDNKKLERDLVASIEQIKGKDKINWAEERLTIDDIMRDRNDKLFCAAMYIIEKLLDQAENTNQTEKEIFNPIKVMRWCIDVGLKTGISISELYAETQTQMILTS